MARKQGASVQVMLDELGSHHDIAAPHVGSDATGKTRKKDFAYFKTINQLGRSRSGGDLADA